MRLIRVVEPVIGEEEERAVIEVLRSKWIAHGPIVEEFEKRFAEYIGVNYALAVSNGTVALDLALKALGITSGDEVLVPDFTFIATANAVLFQGAKPVFVDINLDTYTMDPDDLRAKITGRTRAIIVVHLYGHPADMESILEIASEHGLLVVEDAAQAHGAEVSNIKVGGLGDVGVFSFYATKNITTGEGGMVVTNNPVVAEKVRLLRNHGMEEKYLHVTLGGNYRMTSIQAAIGLVQLDKLDAINTARIKNAELLTELLSEIPGLRPPTVKPGYKHVFHQYVVYVEKSFPLDRDRLAQCLRKHGIETAIHYPRPIHLQPLYRALGYPGSICPNSIEASRHVLSLPVHPLLNREDIEYIAETIKKIHSNPEICKES